MLITLSAVRVWKLSVCSRASNPARGFSTEGNRGVQNLTECRNDIVQTVEYNDLCGRSWRRFDRLVDHRDNFLKLCRDALARGPLGSRIFSGWFLRLRFLSSRWLS